MTQGPARPGVNVFWMRRRPNFGDALAPFLIARFANLEASWASPWRSDAAVIGSVVDRLPARYRGAVIGIGLLERESARNLSGAHILGLRGELTLRAAGLRGEIVLGDSGLLAAELLGRRPETSHPLGVVPHFRDQLLAQRHPDALHIDVSQPPLDVIAAIASCSRIVSSSLHGLVTADAFGLPRRWEPSPAMRGGAFKFADYASALGTTIEPETWASAPPRQVELVIGRLRDAFAALGAVVLEGRRRRHRGLGRLTERLPR